MNTKITKERREQRTSNRSFFVSFVVFVVDFILHPTERLTTNFNPVKFHKRLFETLWTPAFAAVTIERAFSTRSNPTPTQLRQRYPRSHREAGQPRPASYPRCVP